MLAAPLLVMTLALAPSNESIRFDVYAAGHFDYVTPADNPSGYRNLGGRGGLGVTLYLRRFVDDDAPPSLQAYLQRTPELHLDGGGGSASTTWDDPLPHESVTSGWADAYLSGYERWLYAAAHVGVTYSSTSATLYTPGGGLGDYSGSTIGVPVDATLGVRWRDWRVTVGWGVTPTRVETPAATRGFDVQFWGGARAAAATVVKKQLWLEASVLALEQGAGAGADATLYLRRRVGISASIKGGQRAHTDVNGFGSFTQSLDYVGFGVGAVVWATPRVLADVRYDFEWDKHGGNAGGSPIPTSVGYTGTVRLGIGYRR